uniref:Uncharacterized protein n=1 Tax=Rhizophora mucronata TaxID=61149 RepID=A0A2P2R4B4_RHIMU
MKQMRYHFFLWCSIKFASEIVGNK